MRVLLLRLLAILTALIWLGALCRALSVLNHRRRSVSAVSLGNMNTPGIRITRHPYEEPYYLNLHIEASNGRLRGAIEYFCNADDLTKLGKQLGDFTGDRDAEIIYELGSERPSDRFAFFLSLGAKALDSSGHCAVHIRFNNNSEAPNKEVMEFSIRANVAGLNRLGNLLVGFGKLQHRVLEWHVHLS